jgi:hypothetical protein
MCISSCSSCSPLSGEARTKKTGRNCGQKKRIQDPRGLTAAVTATWTPPNAPEVHPLLPMVWSVISRFGAAGVMTPRDVRAVTCMVHITRLDLDQISMPRSDGSQLGGGAACCSANRVPQVRGDTHAADKCHRHTSARSLQHIGPADSCLCTRSAKLWSCEMDMEGAVVSLKGYNCVHSRRLQGSHS